MRSMRDCELGPRIHRRVVTAFRWTAAGLSRVLGAEGARAVFCLRKIQNFVRFVFGFVES